MATLFAQYEDATRETKLNAPTERFALGLLNKEFGHLKLSELRPQDIAEFRDRRLETRKPESGPLRSYRSTGHQAIGEAT